MNGALATLRRELRAYFFSPLAYAILTLFLIVNGFIFWVIVGYLSDPRSRVGAPLELFFGQTIFFWLVLLFGESFRPYGYLVRWWAAFEVLSFLSLPLSVWIRTFEHTLAGFVASLCTATVSIALVYPLVGNFGASGAMIGMIISALTQIAVLGTMVRRMHARARPGGLEGAQCAAVPERRAGKTDRRVDRSLRGRARGARHAAHLKR